jgi:two-component system KDP operon response regulator KdpE
MSAGATVLIVEDERPMRRLLRATLEAHGYKVIEAESFAAGRTAATLESPALIIMDLGLPDGDGVELVRALREWTTVPTIVVSARDREAEKVRALDAGADDYLTKPFGTSELLARVRVALRHAAAARGMDGPGATVEVGPIRVDHDRHEVSVAGAAVHLTPIEFRLLALLARNLGRVLTHRQILLEVWGPARTQESHYVRVHMASLRRKIEREPARPRLLVTEPGVGYRLREPAE